MTQPTTEMTKTNGNGQGLAKPPKTDLRSYLDSPAVRAKLTEAAGKLMKPEDLIRFALIAASRSPDLAVCSRESVLRALLDAAALGIKPGGLMGRGYLVPRKNNKVKPAITECCFDPGWRGLVDIARRSGQIKRIEAHVVHQRDEFSFARTPLTTLSHVPCEDGDPGEIRAAYAVAEFQGGELQVEVVLRRDLDKIRAMAAGGGPWANWGEEMARKTAVRRLCKYLPYDEALDQAMAASDTADSVDIVNVSVDTGPKRGRRSLAAKLEDRGDAPNMLPPASTEEAEGATEGEGEPERDPATGEIVPDHVGRDAS